MKPATRARAARNQAGIALLISIFILLLISVIAIALIVSSGTESALAGNYRSSTGVYYDAMAGLEEARGRLQGKGPSAFSTTDPTTFLPPTGTPLAMGSTYYLVNPVSGESITPWNSGPPYPDNQFNKEFSSSGFANPTNPSPTALSIWNRSTFNPGSYPGPMFKWVRINAVSEKSLNVDADNDGQADDTTRTLYYTGSGFSFNSSAGPQVIELTAFAVLPNGSQKILQYVVAPVPITLPNFPAALTLAAEAGNSVAFSAPTSNPSYYISGNDISVPQLPSCTPGPPVDAIATYHTLAVGAVINGGNGGTGIPVAMQSQYNGLNSAPDVKRDPIANFQTPSQVDGLAQTIIQNADVVITPSGGTATGSDLTPLGMSATNSLIVAIQGNLDLNSWHNTGYGLLLVTGNLNYDPDASWDGIVLVIGQGTVTGSRAGSGVFNGAFYVAQTRDSSGNLLPDPNLGFASVLFAPNMGSVGMRYSSCWINAAQPTPRYKVLSFHEIAQ
ncbi:MAG TPA: hypothetical protein VEI26_02255 [Terriglobales bacterium]|nr:hypothetical protein [Terriglobales bacterium]